MNAVPERLSKGDIMIVMDDLNSKVDHNKILLRHMMGKHGLSDRNGNSERFVEFSSSHRLIMRGTLFEHTIYQKVN